MMPRATATPRALVTADVPLSDGRTLRVGVDGGELRMALGTGTGRGWRETAGEGLELPRTAALALARVILTLASRPALAPHGPCSHPLTARIDLRRADWTGGPDPVWIGRCSACGEDGVPVDDVVVGHGALCETISPRSCHSR